MTSKIQITSKNEVAANWFERHPIKIIALFALLLAMQITPQFKMSPDGVSYMSIAKSLIQHGRLRRFGSSHLRYAPAYPISISPAFLFGSGAFIAVQLIQWIYAILLMWGVYAWFAKYAGRSAIWIAAFTLAGAGYWDLFRTASAEMFFMPSLIWAAFFLAKTADGSKPWPNMIIAIILAAMACATRQIGVMLVPGFGVAMILLAARRRVSWRRAITLSAAFTLCIGAASYGLIVFDHWKAQSAPGDTSYTAIFLQSLHSPRIMVEGARRQVAEVGRLLIPGMFKSHSREHEYLNINNIIYALAFIPVAIGWWKFVRKTADPFALTLPFYVALCIVYPYDSSTRFSVPMLPVIGACIWFAMEPLNQSRAGLFGTLVALHVVVAIGFWIGDALQVHRRYKQLPEIQHVAAGIPNDAEEIALRIDAPRGDNDDRWMFLMWLKDRPVAPETLKEPVDQAADWIVTSPAEPTHPGFRDAGQIGGYKLEHASSISH